MRTYQKDKPTAPNTDTVLKEDAIGELESQRMCTEQEYTRWTSHQDGTRQNEAMIEDEDPESGANLEQQPNNLQTKVRQAGSHQNSEKDQDNYPRHAPRVIMHWVDEVWRDERKLWQHWSIDNYDSMDSHLEHKLTPPIESIKDIEVKASNFHQLRAQLIQVEAKLDGVEEKSEDDQHAMKCEAYNDIKGILMKYYQATLNTRHTCTVEEFETENDRMHKSQEVNEERSRGVWRHSGQGYCVKDWSISDGTINCMW